ncbi:MAG: CvpA family protein [Mogibacterium sp.]|nr:CvpA family protein [Mogibacterium sp.]
MNTIDWWMIDGAVGLIVLVAILRGAIKGVGDTLLKMISIIGGIGLGFYYKDKLKDYLLKTKLEKTMHSHIFELIRGDETVTGSSSDEGVNSFFGSIFGPNGSGEGVLSKSLAGIFKDAADKAADSAAERLTEIAMGVIAFACIILAVSIVLFLIRVIIKSLRDHSIVIGFADRVLGMVLGLVRGIMVAWIAVALLIPVTTLVSPEHVPAMMEALQLSTVAKVLYDVNPFFYVIKYAFI